MNTRFPQLIYLKHDTDALTHFSQDGSQIFNSKFAGSGWLLLQNKHNKKKRINRLFNKVGIHGNQFSVKSRRMILFKVVKKKKKL